MRAPVDQPEASSTTGLTAAWRVATPAPRKIRSAVRSAGEVLGEPGRPQVVLA